MSFPYLTKTLLLTTTLCLLSVGCSSVRVVRVTQDGGEIALLGSREGAMKKARQEMAMQCGGNDKYQIVEQGEVVVGEVTQSRTRARTRRGRRGTRGYASSRTVTRDRTEWRVIFECETEEPQESARHTVSVPMTL